MDIVALQFTLLTFVLYNNNVVNGYGYVSLIQKLNKAKCSLNQYSAIIIGQNIQTDCGSDAVETGSYEGSRYMYPPGTFLRTDSCMATCVPKKRISFHSEAALIWNAKQLLSQHRHSKVNLYFVVFVKH